MDYCWPVDTSCCPDYDAYSDAVKERAEALAASTLQMLTGFRMGGCPVTMRPCRASCAPNVGAPYGSWNPYIYAGTWLNIPCNCGQSTCGCGPLCEIELPPPIGSVQEVRVDGTKVDPAAYRVDDGRFLVRVDGDCWPTCQDLAVGIDQPGAFAVTYTKGLPVDALGAYAAGLLACEYAKACSGGKCRLPSGVTDITRQGISMTIASGAFPGGLTGIREVDAYVQSINPYALKSRPIVWTPTTPTARITTIPAGGVPSEFTVTELSDTVYVGGLAALRVTHVNGAAALDEDIASIDWGDGTVDTAPYQRPGPFEQLITHTYDSPGTMTYVVTPTVGPPITGTFTARYSYWIEIQPDDYEVQVDVEPLRLRPTDAYASELLPVNEHFASIDWADGTVDENPFTLDAEGYATHIFSEVGEHTATVTMLDGQRLRIWSKTVAKTPTFQVTPSDRPAYPYTYTGLEIERWEESAQVWVLANDDDIASITWEPGVVQTAPYPGRIQRLIPHQYETHGLKSWTVDFAHPEVASVSGTIDVQIDYYVGWNPSDRMIHTGEALGMKPLDGYNGNPLPPDEAFASIDWADGSPVQTPPFTVDSDGYATHVYAAEGQFDIDAFFIDGRETGALVMVSTPPPTYTATEKMEYPYIDYDGYAGLLVQQVTPTPGIATDAQIASITWSPGDVQTPPFDRDVLGVIGHTYHEWGPLDWRVDFTDPQSAPVTGTVHVTYYYYIGWVPVNGIIVVGDSIAIRPLDNWQGNPLPPDEHLAAVDWNDGSPIEHPPFTVDSEGFATHVYTVAGTYNIQIGFIDTLITSLGITVTATQEDADALADQPPPVQSKPPPEWVE